MGRVTIHAALIVGAGPAGLATSRELTRAGIDHVVLERGPSIAHTWENLYDGLVLHTGKHLSALPGMPFPAATPLFPTRQNFVDYLHRYADTFRVPVETNAEAVQVVRDGELWLVRTKDGTEKRARAVVMATGIVSNPQVPDMPHRDRFRGRVSHSIEYRRPEPFRGQRVLVVGAGNSGGEISAELAAAGAQVTVAIRSGVRVVPREMFGIPTQYLGFAISPLPRPAQRRLLALTGRLGEMVRGRSPLPPHTGAPKCSDIPLIGFHLTDAVRAGTIRLQGGVDSFTPEGVRFSDGTSEPFDHVMLATGFRASLGILRGLIRLDACGFASRVRRVVSPDQPNLYFVGQNYDVQGGLRNIARDARLAARELSGRPG